jgi:peptidoglycan/LPS O-acetylase OafA/YrhL
LKTLDYNDPGVSHNTGTTEIPATNFDRALGGHSKDEFIQVWRGISAFMVIYYHFSNRVPYTALNAAHAPTIEFYSGSLGVMIFFAISGYLITQSLAGSKDLASFLAKRVSRIWPLFILAAITIFVAMQFLEPPVVTGAGQPLKGGSTRFLDLIGNLFFLQDLGFQWIDGVFWSVLVELKFYLWVAVLACLVPRHFVVIFAVGAAVLASCELFIRIYDVALLAPVAKALNGVFIAQHAPFFAIGALLASGKSRTLLTLNLLVAACTIAWKIGENPHLNALGTTEFIFALAAIFALDSVLLKSRLFLTIGDYSYSWYLFHQMIGLSLIRIWVPATGIDLAIVCALAATFGIAVTGSWIAEWRFRRLFYTALYRLFSLAGLDRAKLGRSHTPNGHMVAA